jgi:membrane fusion protein (multidrug efflux system)
MSRQNMTKRMVIMLISVFVLFGLVFGFGAFKSIMIGKFLAGFANQMQTVATMQAEDTGWQPSLQSVGSVTAVNGASLSAEVPGIVDTIHFESGQDVQKGQLLLTLRPNNDPAILAQLQAQAALAAITAARDTRQLAADAISQAQLDSDRAQLASAQAQVAAQQALIAEKQIRAPFAGRIGIRQVDLGQYLAVGTEIASLQQLNPVYVDFHLPQQAVATVVPGQNVAVSVDAYPKMPFTGTVKALDSNVDQATRSIEVRAQIDNSKLLLRPGMFANINVSTGAPQNFVTLPQTAITYNSYGDTVYALSPYTPPAPPAPGGFTKFAMGVFHGTYNAVYFVFHLGKLPPQQTPPVVQQEYTANEVFVILGQTRGNQVAVLSGVKEGGQIVVAGQVKLRNGAIVAVNNSLLPPNTANPTPPNE